MKRYFTLILVLFCSLLAAAKPDTLISLKMPIFASPVYGFYADNFLGAQAAGRGYTGTSVFSDLGGGLLNPASLRADSTRLYLEANVKPGLAAERMKYFAHYEYPVPLGLAGFSFPLGSSLSAALYYNCPTAIELQDFSVDVIQGADIWSRRPKYYLNQGSLSLAWHQNEALHFGLSLHNQWHYIDDPLFVNTWDRIRDTKYRLRIQPGFIWGNDTRGIGISGTLPTKIHWDQRYEVYDYHLPLEVNAGGHYTYQDTRLIVESQYRPEKINHEAFRDYLAFKVGAEHFLGGNVFRAGYFYNPSVFYGDIRLPENPFAEEDDFFWADTEHFLRVSNSNQHYLSVGYSRYFKRGDLNLALMHAYGGRQPRTQLNLGLSLYTSVFTNPRQPTP